MRRHQHVPFLHVFNPHAAGNIGDAPQFPGESDGPRIFGTAAGARSEPNLVSGSRPQDAFDRFHPEESFFSLYCPAVGRNYGDRALIIAAGVFMIRERHPFAVRAKFSDGLSS